jgi:hypothetical protein
MLLFMAHQLGHSVNLATEAVYSPVVTLSEPHWKRRWHGNTNGLSWIRVWTPS